MTTTMCLDEVPVWHEVTDVLVVGLGAAGACAALEAANNGARVRVLERLNGGGASALSGGVIYAGGGTPYQLEAGDQDTPENLFNYLRLETAGAVNDTTLRAFSDQSAANLKWLEGFGVRFDSTAFDDKTSYPPDKYFLYYSGNELSAPYAQAATPVRRGHRTFGKGFTGKILYAALLAAIQARPHIEISTHSDVTALVLNKDNVVVGVRYQSAPKSSFKRWCLSRINSMANRFVLLTPSLARVLRARVQQMLAGGEERFIGVKQGVLLCSGGFMFNPAMLQDYAPDFLQLRPLGEHCDGKGIAMGMAAGGAVGYMDSVTAWRFITPPTCLLKGLIVTSQGIRVCAEDLYGATTANHLMHHDKGKGWLMIDQELMDETKAAARPGKMSWSQWLPIRLFIHCCTRRADTLAQLANVCDLPEETFLQVVEDFNHGCENNRDRFNKSLQYQRPLQAGPYYAIDISVHNPVVPCLSMTLGGLVVDEDSGAVLDSEGRPIGGLYAAGRAAVGICSRSYVSGLSLADCIFSGRRAGLKAATLASAPGGNTL